MFKKNDHNLFGYILLLLFLGISALAKGQAGLSTSPLRLFFSSTEGATQTQKVTIANPTDREAEIGVFFADWDYDEIGNTKIHESKRLATSCSDDIKVLPESFFVLAPHEQKQVDVVFTAPHVDDPSKTPVLTSLLLFQQLNPFESSQKTPDGAALKIAVRVGVKIYYSVFADPKPEIDIDDFTMSPKDDSVRKVVLHLSNTGNLWANGKIQWNLFNQNTGDNLKVDETKFYTLPGDQRIVEQKLPNDLKAGNYILTAKLNYGDQSVIKMADLTFEITPKPNK